MERLLIRICLMVIGNLMIIEKDHFLWHSVYCIILERDLIDQVLVDQILITEIYLSLSGNDLISDR